jgi:hypothetical protein
MDDKISHASHFTPLDFRVFGACFFRNPPCCLADNFNAADNSVLTLDIGIKLIPGFIKDII